MSDNQPYKMNAEEALFAFMAWLTSREEPVTLSGRHGATDGLELVTKFIKANNLGDVSREDWHKFIVFPKEDNGAPRMLSVAEAIEERQTS